MKSLGTYKTEYNQGIDIYTDLVYQYNLLTRQFENDDYEVSVETEKSGGKKSPIFASLETLRKDIGVWSDRLMLNPKSFRMDEGPSPGNRKKASPFAQFMREHGGDET